MNTILYIGVGVGLCIVILWFIKENIKLIKRIYNKLRKK